MEMATWKMAKLYDSLGFIIVPIKYKKKGIVKGFYEKTKNNMEELEVYFNNPEKPYNIGILTGIKSKLIVVDFNTHEAFNIVQDEHPETAVVNSLNGYHFYFKSNTENLRTVKKYVDNVDVLANGSVIVAPPSINKEGKEYTFMDENALNKIAELPNKIKENVLSRTNRITIPKGYFKNIVNVYNSVVESLNVLNIDINRFFEIRNEWHTVNGTCYEHDFLEKNKITSNEIYDIMDRIDKLDTLKYWEFDFDDSFKYKIIIKDKEEKNAD